MRATIVVILIIANISVLYFILNSFNHGRANHVMVSDLRYGKVDVDGDGTCTSVDDAVLDWLLENCPHHVEKALLSAEMNENLEVDISKYLNLVAKEKALEHKEI